MKTKRYKNIICNYILLLFIGLSCNKTDSELDIFFKQIDSTLSIEEKSKLIETDSTSHILKFVFTNNNNKFQQLFDNLPRQIVNTLDSFGIKKYPKLSLLSAYVKNKNNKVIDFHKIEEEVKLFFSLEQQAKEQQSLKEMDRLTNIAKNNYEKINLSDTISLKFPLDNINGVCKVVYRLPNEEEELIEIKCEVLDKSLIIKSKEYKFDTDQFKLKLKILKFSKDNCLFMSEKLKVGNQMSLEIFDYGREITVGNVQNPNIRNDR